MNNCFICATSDCFHSHVVNLCRFIEVWLDYICAELSQHGDAVKGGMIQSRALLHLPEGPLREKFVQRYRTLSNM